MNILDTILRSTPPSNISELLECGFVAIKSITQKGDKVFKLATEDMSQNLYAIVKGDKVNHFASRLSYSREQFVKNGIKDHFGSTYGKYDSSGRLFKDGWHSDYGRSGGNQFQGVRTKDYYPGGQIIQSTTIEMSPSFKIVDTKPYFCNRNLW
ncbi:hypothetical protein IKU74_01355 [bacterium]|nr:hypothetical protein [bacterium]